MRRFTVIRDHAWSQRRHRVRMVNAVVVSIGASTNVNLLKADGPVAVNARYVRLGAPGFGLPSLNSTIISVAPTSDREPVTIGADIGPIVQMWSARAELMKGNRS